MSKIKLITDYYQMNTYCISCVKPDHIVTSYIMFEYVRSIREAWIKAKYVERAFVKQTTLPNTAPKCSSVAGTPSSSRSVRQWSVYKRKRKPTVSESAATSNSVDTDSHSTKGYLYDCALVNVNLIV